MAYAARADARTLPAAGCSVENGPALRHLTSPLLAGRTVARDASATRLQRAGNCAARFPPPVSEPLSGYRLSGPDPAANKALAGGTGRVAFQRD